MPSTGFLLPPDVQALLDAGRTIDAIKQLRVVQGLGLKEAKDLIDAHQQGHHAAPPAHSTGFASDASSHVPDSVRQALAAGNKIEAIRLLRAHAGIGLREAKDRVDALAASTGSGNPHGLSPGEQPRGGSQGVVWIVAALVVAVAAFYLLRP